MRYRKLTLLLTLIPALLAGCGNTADSGPKIWPVLLVIFSLFLLVLAGLRTYSIVQYNHRTDRYGRKRRPRRLDPMTISFYVLAVLLIFGSMLGSCNKENHPVDDTLPIETEDPNRISLFKPKMTADTNPDNWGIRWEIIENGAITHTFNRQEPIFIDTPSSYFALPGIATFRGNNYRNNAAYGTATIKNETLSLDWTASTSSPPSGIWEGTGWIGQPLIVKWDSTTKAIMNLFENKRTKANLVEVIYANVDGHIYFLDLDDGTPTRNPINMGMCFKGSGALDPRGYPLLYVGAGDKAVDGQRPRMFVISLIDGKVLFEYGHEEDLSYRQDHDRWCAFDASPLIDAQTDTLIWPAESGLLYTIKLNTRFDKTAGTISIRPDSPVATRYLAGRSNQQTRLLGYEVSASIVENYLYISENGGLFYCVDLNTMELIWVQDTMDTSYSSPVLQKVSDTEAYLYTAPSLHWTKDEIGQGSVCVYKLDALTGEIVWEKSFHTQTASGISGGILSTPLLGKAGSSIENLVIYTVSRTPDKESGVMVALDTANGKEVWTMDMDRCTWSSPIALYTADGTAYIVVCDAAGMASLVDGTTGQLLSTLDLNGSVEASPVAYENTLVVGTWSKKICAIKVK